MPDVDPELIHYGVPGMKWGVRKSVGSSGNVFTRKTENTPKTQSDNRPTNPVIVISKSNSSKISTKGGERHPASREAMEAARISRKLKKSGVNSLTNKEMQDLSTRLNLEQQMSRLGPPTTAPRQRAQKAVKEFLVKNGNQAVNQITKTAMNLAIQMMFKRWTEKEK